MIRSFRAYLLAGVVWTTSVALITGCGTVDGSGEKDYEQVVRVSGDFSVYMSHRSFTSRRVFPVGVMDLPRFDRSWGTVFAYNATVGDWRPTYDGVHLTLDGHELTSRNSEDPRFEHQPGRAYRFEASYLGDTIRATVTAPTIDAIEWISHPDSVLLNESIPLDWRFTGGENNGAIIITAGSQLDGAEFFYSSGILDPGTTSHTIPANTLRPGVSHWIHVNSVRYVLFEGLETLPVVPDELAGLGMHSQASASVGVRLNIAVREAK